MVVYLNVLLKKSMVVSVKMVLPLWPGYYSAYYYSITSIRQL